MVIFQQSQHSLVWRAKRSKKAKSLVTLCAIMVSSFLTRPAPKNEDEMMIAIFEYIDR